MTATQRAIGYVRVSTDRQAEDGVSLDAQKAKLAAWCSFNDAELVEVHEDAQTGKRADNREGLQAALDAVCRVGGVLVVYSLSRLARNTKETLEIAERLERAGANLVSLSERIDTTSAAGKMVFRMLAVLAEFERDQLAERTHAAMSYMKSQGQRVGTVPLGKDLADDGVSLVDNADEQRVLDVIADMRRKSWSLRKIAAELTARGIPTKEGNTTWSHSTIQRLVSRQAA